MTTTPQRDMDAEARARQAVEDLAAEGLPVTARTVRERAGVRMTVATAAAREHAEALAAVGEVPDVPDVVMGRVAAIWREAVVLARGEHAEAAASWGQRITDLTTEKDEIAADLTAAEAARDDLAEKLERARADLAESRTAAERAAAEHAAEMKALRAELDAARKERADAEAREAAATSRADTLQAVIDQITPGK